MADPMKGLMTKEKVSIYNPENRKHYKIRYRKSKKGKQGHLINEWTP